MLDDKYIDSLVKQAADFGNGKIHIIVNNAGYTWDGVIHKVCAPDPDRSTSQAVSLPAEIRNLGSQ
jgi:hypothetical protein